MLISKHAAECQFLLFLGGDAVLDEQKELLRASAYKRVAQTPVQHVTAAARALRQFCAPSLRELAFSIFSSIVGSAAIAERSLTWQRLREVTEFKIDCLRAVK